MNLELDIEDEDFDDIKVEKDLGHKSLSTNPSISISIRLNPYLSLPGKALAAMGRICSAKPSDYIKGWNKTVNEILYFAPTNDEMNTSREDEADSVLNLETYFFSNRRLFDNQDFLYSVRDYISNLILSMDRQMQRFTPKTVRVAVGGSFTGGKSSLLNHILNADGLLPVDVGASTMVPAMLYCGNFPEKVSVSGVNNLNAIVSLDKEILNCIRHSANEKNDISANIAAALQHFIVRVQCEKYEDIVFIDTPGYDNPEDVSSRLLTDEEIADKYISMGDVVLWLKPITDGDLNQKDIKRLNWIGGERNVKLMHSHHRMDYSTRKVIILLSFADLLEDSSRQDVFEKICQSVSSMKYVVDVATISTFNKKSWERYWHSRSGDDFDTILKKAIDQIPVNHETSQWIKKIQNLFRTEISATNIAIKRFEEKCHFAKLICLDCIQEKHKVKRRKQDLFDSNNDLSVGLKMEIEAQIQREIKSLDEEYRLQNENICKYTDRKQSLEEHLDLIKKWMLKLENWFLSEPILDYNGNYSETNDLYEDSIRVYFKISNKIKGISCNIHYWNENSGTTWPGLPMTYVIAIKKNNIWVADIPKWATGIVFAVLDENGSVIDQSINFTNTEIKDQYSYYRKRRAGRMDLKQKYQRKSYSIWENTSEDKTDSVPPVFIREIFEAIRSNDFNLLIKALSYNCDITGHFNQKKMSVITAAAHHGFRKALELLVDFCGVEILNIADGRGFNALHSAANALKFETCADILGWDPTLKDYSTLDGKLISELIPIEHMSILNNILSDEH